MLSALLCYRHVCKILLSKPKNTRNIVRNYILLLKSCSCNQRITRKLTCLGSTTTMHNYLTDYGKNGRSHRKKGLWQKKKNTKYPERGKPANFEIVHNNEKYCKIYSYSSVFSLSLLLQWAIGCIYRTIFCKLYFNILLLSINKKYSCLPVYSAN